MAGTATRRDPMETSATCADSAGSRADIPVERGCPDSGRLLPLMTGRVLPPSSESSVRSPPPGSPLLAGPSPGGPRPTRLLRGTVTLTLMPAGKGRWLVAEGVHHGLVDPIRPLNLLRSPSRGTPSGSSLPGPAPAVTSVSEPPWEAQELVDITGKDARACELSPPVCSSARSPETPGAGRLKAAIWLVRSVERVIAVMASPRSCPRVRCSPAARAEAAIASRVASSSRASMVGSSRRIWETPSPAGRGRETHRRSALAWARSAWPSGSISIRARSRSRPTCDTLRPGA